MKCDTLKKREEAKVRVKEKTMGDKTRAKNYLTIEQVKEKMKEAKDPKVLKRWLIVYTALIEPRKAKDISTSLGVSLSLVQKVMANYNREGPSSIVVKNSGGRHHETITKKEEIAFLAPFFERAEQGMLITVDEIHEAFTQFVGKKVNKTTIYRLLHRHGWRKLQPRLRHPQAAPEAEVAFKKNSQLRWKKRPKPKPQMTSGQLSSSSKTKLADASNHRTQNLLGPSKNEAVCPISDHSSGDLRICCYCSSNRKISFSHLTNCKYRYDEYLS